MVHTSGSHKSTVKFSPDETLPSNREMIPGNWALGIHRSTYSSQSSMSLPVGASMFKRVQDSGSEDTLASFASFQGALIEASKSLIVPQLPPYNPQVVEKHYREALSTKRAVITCLVNIQAQCEDYEGKMYDHIGEAATECFITENYIIEDTDTVKGKYYEAVSALTIRGFGISYDCP